MQHKDKTSQTVSTAFEERLRAVGAAQYHDKHPFNLAMHAGTLTREQIQGWVANRYYYQKCIPVKDSAILSNLPDREKRRWWIKRIIDHDGTLEAGGGGTESWLELARAVALDPQDVAQEKYVLPGTRFAVDAYVTLARTAPWIVAVASSLTELFAPELMAQRIVALREKYPWIEERGLAYFQKRLALAPRDSAYALAWVREHAVTPDTQAACVRALQMKCDVLWSMLDAVANTYGIGPVKR